MRSTTTLILLGIAAFLAAGGTAPPARVQSETVVDHRIFCRIGGDLVSLDYIEHEILRPRFKDPRVHMAINCASRSCPPLRAEPYTGAALDRQLNEMTTAFINDPQRNYLEGDTLHVSKIFKWFAEDFDQQIVRFFLTYAQGGLKRQLLGHRQTLELAYLDYDWSLNSL